MSDFNQKGPDQNDPFGNEELDSFNPWQQRVDPFAAYDDPMAQHPMGGYAMPSQPAGLDPTSFLMDNPAPIGAEMQQGGVPMPQGFGDDFLQGDQEAPTRIGMPSLNSQMVNKRKTVDKGERSPFARPLPTQAASDTPEAAAMPEATPETPVSQAAPAPQSDVSGTPFILRHPDADQLAQGPRARRAGRTARYHEDEGPAPVAPVSPAAPEGFAAPAAHAAPEGFAAPAAHAAPEGFAAPAAPAVPEDFAAPAAPASRNLTPAPSQRAAFTPAAPSSAPVFTPSAAPEDFDPFGLGDTAITKMRAMRRSAEPGARYTGARTAMPQSGAPVLRSQVGSLSDDDAAAPSSVQSKAAEARERAKAKAKTGYAEDVNKAAAAYQRPPQMDLDPSQQEPLQDEVRQRPAPQQRPAMGPDGRPMRPAGRPAGADGRPAGADGRPAGAGSPARRPAQPGVPGAPAQRSAQAGVPTGRPAGAAAPMQRSLQAGGPDMPGQRPNRSPDGQPARPAAPQRPQDAPRSRKNPAAVRPELDDDSIGYPPSRRNPADSAYRPNASVRRPNYDFEDEDEIDPPRRSALTPLLIVLLVIGLLLAGILIPKWDAAAGGIGGIMGGIKESIVGVFDNVKSTLFPSEVRLTSFTATPTDGTAPAELIFNVQTSPNVTDLRIVDDLGNTVIQKTLTDEDTLNGTVAKNSKGMIWTLHYTAEDEYNGLYTAQTLLSDGTWDEGLALVAPVSIAAPPVPQPPVQSFDCDTNEGNVPAAIGFVAQTSGDVVAVRVVDDYGVAVATFSLIDEATETASVVESVSGLTWELTANVDEAYEGSYRLEYRTDAELNFTASDYNVYVELTAPTSQGTTDGLSGDLSDDAFDAANLLPDAEDPQGKVVTASASADLEDADPAVMIPADDGDGAADGDIADDGEDAGVSDEDPVDVATGDTEAAATPAPQATPAPTALPALQAQADASADPEAIKLSETLYIGDKTAKSFERTKTIAMLDPFNYAVWDQSGVLTFRSGPLRQNAAYGTVEVKEEKLTQVWQVPVGSKKLASSTVYGIAWPGQPAIVKWPIQVRQMMNLNAEKKNTTALKEVILGAQDGFIYFLDLMDGQATREPIDMGAPSGSGVSIATNASPILGVGQTASKLAGKQVDNGYHLYNLLNSKELLLINGRDKAANSNYNGATGAAIFDKLSKTLIIGGQNGVLYTVELNDDFDYQAGSLKLSPVTQKYKTLASKQDKKNTNIDGSVAMYNNYVYYGDETGVLQCVNINTLTPVWAIKTGDNIDATPALDMEAADTVALYTGNTIKNQGKKGVCTLRRIDALTGAEAWAYEVPDTVYSTEVNMGLMASPVVGEKSISDLVIFTVTTGKESSQVIALSKRTGAVVWSTPLESATDSSPVAVYNENGDAWIIQAESSGKIHLLSGKTGAVLNTLQVEGVIEASPAVYRNMLIIGTTGKETGYIYGIQIQ